MRILFLSQVLPYPPDAGPKIRSYYVLRYLAERHQITLVSFIRATDTPEAVDHLRSLCERVITIPIHRSRQQDLLAFIRSLAKNAPLMIERDFVPAMQITINEVLREENFQAIHCDQLWMAQYVPFIQGSTSDKTSVFLVLDEHNACFQIFKRLAQREQNLIKRLVLARDWRLLKEYERAMLHRFNRVVSVTREDQSILQNLLKTKTRIQSKNPRISTIPICVDTENVQPVSFPVESQQVLHLGTMFWPPNIEGVEWFIEKVWPRVLAEIPQAEFIIAGKNPPQKIVQFAQDSNNRIKVTGYIPDPRPFLNQAGAFIVPLFSGSGMRVKILDAWKWGLPVVSTRIGAEGLSYENGMNILIADSAQEFGRAVIDILKKSALSENLRLNGRAWVGEHYNWKRVYPAWGDLYNLTQMPINEV